MQKSSLVALFLAAMVALLAFLGLRQYRAGAALRQENEALRAEIRQVDSLAADNHRLSNLVAKAQAKASPQTNDQFRELMKLRGEVGVLRQTANEAAKTAAAQKESPLSGLTSNPEMNKMIRDQQKLALGMVYGGFAKKANLSKEKTEELTNLMADDVMTNIDHITSGLRAGKTAEQMEPIFAQQEKDLQEKVEKLLGPEASAQYQEYNRNLGSYLTAEQFKGMLGGNDEAKEAQTKQLYQLMQQETEKALAARGLDKNYQIVPTLNFRNIAFEQEGDKNLQLLDSIYEQVETGASSFLNAEELQKFGQFRKLAVNNNRLALSVNRKLMAPAGGVPK